MAREVQLPKHISFSQAEKWHDCPKKWEAIYLRGVEDRPGEEAERGTLTHDVLEKLFALPPGERTKAAAREILTARGEDQPRDRRRMSWGVVLAALDLEDAAGVEVVAVEVEFDVTIAGIRFRGRIDRVDEDFLGSLRVVDYKGGRRPPPMFLDEKRWQVALYAEAYAELTGERVTEGALLWLASRRIDEVNIGQVRDEALEWLVSAWEGITTGLTTGEYPATPGPLCGWCPVLADCAPGQEMVRERLKAGKSGGPGGEMLIVRDMEATLAARKGEHLHLVEDGDADRVGDGGD